MNAGRALLEIVRENGADCAFVVGAAKNVGKTVAARALYAAAGAAGLRVGFVSIGRDGEAFDAVDPTAAKPRLFLRPGTTIATARGVLPGSPACELLELSQLQTAAGTLVYAAVREPAYFELVGPPTASGVREAVGVLRARCDLTIVDGAVDRVAAVAGGGHAIVVAGGAASAPTPQGALDALAGLVLRLQVPAFDPAQPHLRIEGGLGPAAVARLVAAGERRQVVVRDPTQIALAGKAVLSALSRLTVRCERPLRPVAVTVAPSASTHTFEPTAFLTAAAGATGLPAFDVLAGAYAA